jgi:hypothetical protein
MRSSSSTATAGPLAVGGPRIQTVAHVTQRSTCLIAAEGTWPMRLSPSFEVTVVGDETRYTKVILAVKRLTRSREPEVLCGTPDPR